MRALFCPAEPLLPLLTLLVLPIALLGCKDKVDTGDTMSTDITEANATFLGAEPGDMAGYSIANVGDVDADGMDELLIGAKENDEIGDQAGVAYVVGADLGGNVDLSIIETRIVAESSFAWLGAAVAGGGDISGDGVDDIIIGAPLDSTGGRGAGMAYVIYGIIDDQTNVAEARIRIEGLEEGDAAGTTVAILGDVNEDGLDDFLVGSQHYVPERSMYMMGYIFYPPESGRAVLDDSDADIAGQAVEGETSYSLAAAGDVDGDGAADILVGAELNDQHGLDAGCGWLIMGPVEGTAILSNEDVLLFQGELDGDNAGAYVASAGDLNGDGLADILIGAPGEDTGAMQGGAVYVLFGPANTTIFLSGADAKIVAEKANDGLGRSFSQLGDVNGDAQADLLIGAKQADGAAMDSGAAWIVTGPFAGQMQIEDFRKLDGFGMYDEAGFSVAGIGNLDGDDLADVAIGAPYADHAGTDAGAVYLFLGNRL